jgi:exoribonuclease R
VPVPSTVPAAGIEQAFRRARAELDVREGFPDEVLRAAERAAAAGPRADERADLAAIPFVTVDPPGSRDLDQAVHVERDGDGYRLRYAIADVAAWVERGGPVEEEAWRRGVTFYAPDHREPLYPPVLSQGAASLLPDGPPRPAVVFDVRLDARADVRGWHVERALVRSRAQLTYVQLRDHVARPDTSPLAGTEGAETLRLLGEVGPARVRREVERGGVSLPVREQHVQRRAATALGYRLAYEAPNVAEAWNAQVSLLAGHLAATAMLDAGVGLLRTMPPFHPRDVARFRRVARTLGFAWPEERTYAEFLHAVPAEHPRVETLVRQARRTMRGADYVAFDGAPPEQPLHGALAFPYAHTTAPLRRLADRYVLDLLVTLARGARPAPAEVATLAALVPVMDEAGRKGSALERRVVDVAEAWALRDRVGDVLPAVVVDVRGREVEVQVEEPPLRAELPLPEGEAPPPVLGSAVRVRVAQVDAPAGTVRLALAAAG